MLLYVPQIVRTQTESGTRSRATATTGDASSCSAGIADSPLVLSRIDAGGQLVDQIIVKVVIRQMTMW